MIYTPTSLPDVVVLDPERHADERGFFARTFCAEELRAQGLNPRVAQCSVSFNAAAGTLRGLHHQVAPHQEAKLVRCTKGAVYDVVVDLRPESPTHRRWVAVTLSAENHRQVYVPEGHAHGFITLEDDSEVCYQISAPYQPEAAAGVRWNDPAFGIAWPMAPTIISARDAGYPDYQPDGVR